MVSGPIGGSLLRGMEAALAAAAGRWPEPVLRLGVTGLSGAGKTVFLTSLVSNLLERGRMGQLKAEAAGRIEAVYLQPQPDMTLPRFAYEDHLALMTGDDPRWPHSTRAISQLRLSFLLKADGLLAGIKGPRRLHLDIVDYPGEWLLDLPLLSRTYAEWSEEVLDGLARSGEGHGYLAMARAEDGALPHDEGRATALSRAWRDWLAAARAAGRVDGTPGRFVLPGDLEGAPALTFAPLPLPASTPRGCLWRQMQRRFEAYKAQVVTPFFRDHFARIDRQIVLVDVLGALHSGPRAVEELRRSMASVLLAFRPGRKDWFSGLTGARRVERILFAATRADHLHQSQHAALTSITAALLREARERADFAGAKTSALALASCRATVEQEITREGRTLGAVRGRLAADGRQAVMYPGELPADPARILSPARLGAERWLDADFALMAFAPARRMQSAGGGLPHIRLDRAAEFLIGDRL